LLLLFGVVVFLLFVRYCFVDLVFYVVELGILVVLVVLLEWLPEGQYGRC
jgi:hypothetical protein